MADIYGADVSTFPDLDVRGIQINGPRAVAECLLRRLMTKNASIGYDTDAGYDLRDLLNEDLSDRELRRHALRASAECEKDERILSATVTLSLDRSTHRLTVRITGELVDLKTFDLTASITSISSELLSLR
jgi:hypothetical protein